MYISNFLGSNAPLVESGSILAGENVAQGQLAVLGANNLAYAAIDPNNVPYATNMRPISSLAAQYNQTLIGPTSLSGIGSNDSTSFLLSNGNVGIVYAQSSALYFAAWTTDMAVAVSPVQIATDFLTSAAAPCVIPLSGGGFAVTYCSSAASYPKFGIFSNTGSVVSAIAAIASTALTTSVPTVMCQTSTGNIVVGYTNASGSPGTHIAIFSATGSVVTATTGVTIGGGGITSGQQFLIAVGTVGYALALPSGNGGVAFYLGTFTHTGTVINTAALTGTEPGSGQLFVSATLSNGSIAITNFSTNTAFGVSVGFVSPAGVISSPGASTTVLGVAPTAVAIVGGLAGNAFAILYGYASAMNLQVISSAGALVGSALSIDTAISPTVAAATLTNGVIVVAYGTSTSTKVAQINASTFAAISTPVTLGYVSDNPIPLPLPLSNPAPAYTSSFLIAGASTTGIKSSVLVAYIQMCTPIGVFVANTSSGSAASIQYTGVATLASGFKQTFALNTQANTPPGQKMNVVGNSVLLYGIQ